jgi:hypothetical protein
LLAGVVSVAAVAVCIAVWLLVAALAEAGCVIYAILGLACASLLLGPVVVFAVVKKAVKESSQCECPGCGKLLERLAPGTNDGVQCPACKGYFEGTDGQLWETDANRIGDKPLFQTSLPAAAVFPDGCCVCGKPVTRREKFHVADAILQIPHCDTHRGGAVVEGSSPPSIRFRSLPYMRAFQQANADIAPPSTANG